MGWCTRCRCLNSAPVLLRHPLFLFFSLEISIHPYSSWNFYSSVNTLLNILRMNVWNLYMKSWPGHVKIIRFLLAHKLISLCMASVNNCWYSHGINIRVHYFKIWCATFNKMSLNHYGKCLLVFIWLHYNWISLILKSLCAISFECPLWCAQLCSL